jgi:hypothetical protein
MPRQWFALLLLLCAWSAGAGPGLADEAPPGKPAPGDKPGGAKPDEPDDSADDKVPFVEEVNRAIEQGVRWLKAKPKTFLMGDAQAAHWGLISGGVFYDPNAKGEGYTHPAGPTALALYALLKCGVDPKDPVITEGFHWLRAEHIITKSYDGVEEAGVTWSHLQAGGAYELSAMILALTAKYDQYKRTKNSAEGIKKGKLKITEKADLDWLHALVQALVERRGLPATGAMGSGMRGWRYNVPVLSLQAPGKKTWKRETSVPPNDNQDLSSTQFAALALYSAHRFGVKVDPQVWWDIVEFTLAHQEEKGPERKRHDPGYTSGGYAPLVDHARGFMYLKGSPDRHEGKATGSMTGCGLAILLIAKEVLLGNDKGRALWLEKKYDKTVEKAVNDGVAWLDLHWSPFDNPVSGSYPIYYLYSVERAMDILGKNLIGKHLWYTEGAKSILGRAKHAKVDERQPKGGPRQVDGTYWENGPSLEPKDVLDTCFALLFLKRATRGLVPLGEVTGGDAGPADNR